MPAMASAMPTDPELPDSTVAVSTTKVKKGWWTIGSEVANNSSFFGRNTAKRYPYTAATLTYVHHTGLWASATAYTLFDTKEYFDETDLSLGYSFKVKDLVETNVSYSHFIFGKNTPLVKSVTSNAFSARTALDWGILYTGLTTSYILGENQDMFTVLENSRFIPLNPLWDGKHVIGLDPKVTITAGTQRFNESYTTITKQRNGILPIDNSSKEKPLGSTPLGGILNPSDSEKTNNENQQDDTSTTTTTTKEVSRFNVLNYDLKLPVVIYVGNFELEPAYRYSIPINKLKGDESKAQSFYSFNISYTF